LITSIIWLGWVHVEHLFEDQNLWITIPTTADASRPRPWPWTREWCGVLTSKPVAPARRSMARTGW
jgi:hypothetical protein